MNKKIEKQSEQKEDLKEEKVLYLKMMKIRKLQDVRR